MTEAVNVANNTLLKNLVGEKTTTIVQDTKCIVSKSLSPTPTSSSKDDSSVGSSSLPAASSMGQEGEEKNEFSSQPTEKQAPLSANNNKKQASEKSETLNDGDRVKNPDSNEVKTPGVVVPSVIRISPNTNKNTTTEAAVRDSPRITVVRPKASKTPPQEAPDVKPRFSENGGTAAASKEEVKPALMGERGGKGDKQASKKEEIRRRDEAQTAFPRRNKANRMTSGRAGHADGQAPTQHVHYAGATGAARHQQHSHRQDAQGYRQQQQARGSMASSAGGGTPTLAARRTPQHPRGMSAGSHASDMDEPSPSMPPATPLFQRLVTEEVQELKAYTRIIEEQNRRVTELERRTADLDKRLLKKDKEKADLERTLEHRETQWRNKFERLEADRDHQKELVEQEKRMNTKLNYQVAQMEQEIHKFLTRKVCAI